ncbi:MAG: IMP cyclohydrolase [Hornefia sp.]|nr:IMP cyclohydrolase [Hornefia sp.]
MNVYESKNIKDYIKGNPYVGRGIIIGRSPDGKKAVTAYFIMGRSANSRNRVFEEIGDEVMIKPFDESKVEDPSLIIYYPLRVCNKKIIVTNGDQTDTIKDFMETGMCFQCALRTRSFEPDGPNWTPRISGLVSLEDDFTYKMSILKSADPEGTSCSRYFFEYQGIAGQGHFIHTYVTDGNPIPSFTGEPKRLLMPDDIDEMTNEIWDNLNEDNKISLYVRYTDIDTGEYEKRIINKWRV